VNFKKFLVGLIPPTEALARIVVVGKYDHPPLKYFSGIKKLMSLLC